MLTSWVATELGKNVMQFQWSFLLRITDKDLTHENKIRSQDVKAVFNIFPKLGGLYVRQDFTTRRILIRNMIM